MRLLKLLTILVPVAALAQEKETADRWEPLRFFVGAWQGEVSGKSGVGKGEREYRFILGDNYLHVKNKAVFEPQEKNPEGEVHEDQGFFSYDRARNQFVFRQFHIEGFFNQYVVDSISLEAGTIVMTTESIENGPPGMKARYILEIENENEFTEVFELAFPGRDLKACLTNRWTRRK